ncbi:hypothetical protein CLAIMM_10254, partial [Cladophialophora immunda]
RRSSFWGTTNPLLNVPWSLQNSDASLFGTTLHPPSPPRSSVYMRHAIRTSFNAIPRWASLLSHRRTQQLQENLLPNWAVTAAAFGRRLPSMPRMLLYRNYANQGLVCTPFRYATTTCEHN